MSGQEGDRGLRAPCVPWTRLSRTPRSPWPWPGSPDEKSTECSVAQPWWALRTWRESALTSQWAALLKSAEGVDIPSDVKTAPQGITATYCLLGTHKSQALLPSLAGFYLYYCCTLTRSPSQATAPRAPGSPCVKCINKNSSLLLVASSQKCYARTTGLFHLKTEPHTSGVAFPFQGLQAHHRPLPPLTTTLFPFPNQRYTSHYCNSLHTICWE